MSTPTLAELQTTHRDDVMAALEQILTAAIGAMAALVATHNEALRAATVTDHRERGGTDPEHRVHNKYPIDLHVWLVNEVGADPRLGKYALA